MRTSLALILLIFVPSLAAQSTRPLDPNEVVLRAAYAYRDGGGYNLKWGGTGTPEEIRFDGQRVLARGTDGTYCCGVTFAVVMKAGQQLKLFNGKSIEQIRRFQKEWYGAVEEPDVREQQCSVAIERLGVGKSVPYDQARPGDFMQFWRTKSGHSVIFLDWVTENGKRVGFRYRSSQGSTKGIGDKIEYFSDTGREKAEVDRNRVYFGRLALPEARP